MIIEDKLLNIMDLSHSENSLKLVREIVENTKNDIEYVIDKLPSLKDKLNHVKGYITASSNRSNIKITFDKNAVSEEIKNEFFEICDKWTDKYKIETEIDVEKLVIYIL